MVDTGKVLSEGFDIWKRNLNICLPFVFSVLLICGSAALILGSALLVAAPSLIEIIERASERGQMPPALISQVISEIMRNFIVIIAAIVVVIVLAAIINAFFSAGAIGMAREAILKGRTSIADMTYYGAKKFLSVLGADIIVTLISLVGIVFFVPALIYALIYMPYTHPASIIEDMREMQYAMFFALVFVGFILFFLYLLIISIVFALPRYAVVMDDMNAVDGVKKAFKIFMAHKLDVFLLWLLILVISMLVSIFFSFIGITFNIVVSPLIPLGDILNIIATLIVIQPLTVIWWSRFYGEVSTPSTIQQTAEDLCI